MLATIKTVEEGNSFRLIQNLTRIFKPNIENYIEVMDSDNAVISWRLLFKYNKELYLPSSFSLNQEDKTIMFEHNVDVNLSYGTATVGSFKPVPATGFFSGSNPHISYELTPLRSEQNLIKLSLDFWEKL